MLERAGPAEVRNEGRRLLGRPIRYGDFSPSHREAFAPGAFSSIAPDLALNLEHDRGAVLATTESGALSIRADAEGLALVAELPAGPLQDRALAEVRAGRLAGLSLEFFARQERRQGATRIVERAFLDGVGLVRAPSYPASHVEARQAEGMGALAGLIIGLLDADPAALEAAALEAGIDPATAWPGEPGRPPIERLRDLARAFGADFTGAGPGAGIGPSPGPGAAPALPAARALRPSAAWPFL